MSSKTVRKPPFFKSIRTRLLIGYALFLVSSMILISLYLSAQVKINLNEVQKNFLRSELDTAVSYLEQEVKDAASMSNYLSRQTVLTKGPFRIRYALFNEKGLVLARSEDFAEDRESVSVLLREATAPNPEHSHERLVRKEQAGKFFLRTRTFRDRTGQEFYLQFAMAEEAHTEILSAVWRAALLAIPILLFLAVAGGFFITRRALHPVEKLGRAARELSLTDLSRELPVSGTGDELDQLAETFNDVFRRLRESYQRVIRFTADASHELRLPITAIKGEAEVVLERERTLEEYRKVLSNIIEEFNRLSRLVGQLLALARADSGEDRLEKKPVNLSDLVSKLTEFYKPLAEEKKLSLSSDGERDVQVLADDSRLQELFANLIENAIKYTPSGGNISLKVLNGEKNCKVTISDTGVGIAKEFHNKIFERFFRVDKSRSRDQGGSGLGLSIADSIAKAHRGFIGVESEPGKGSTFIVTLPKT